MAKMVGLSRKLKLAWLNQTASLVSDGLTDAEIKDNLNEYLSFEIGSPTVVRKTREILMCIWDYENIYTEKLRPTALYLFKKYPEYAVEIHWCMMLAAYPVFQDVCGLIGKMSEFQDEITLTQLKQKIYDEWGERATLYHSIDKIIATLKEMGVIVSEKPGKYTIKEDIVNEVEAVSFMIYCVMNIENETEYTFQEINSLSYLFPFKYMINKEDILHDDRFLIINHRGERCIMLNK